MQPLLDCSSQDESSGEDNYHPLNPNEQPLDPQEQRPQAPKRIRLTPASIRVDTFSNEVEKDKEVPEKCCAVCCRLLYPENYCKLSESHKADIEKVFVKDRSLKIAFVTIRIRPITFVPVLFSTLSSSVRFWINNPTFITHRISRPCYPLAQEVGSSFKQTSPWTDFPVRPWPNTATQWKQFKWRVFPRYRNSTLHPILQSETQDLDHLRSWWQLELPALDPVPRGQGFCRWTYAIRQSKSVGVLVFS